MPRSSAVVRPSASAPTTTWPFSMRSVLIASVPYGMIPNSAPAAITAFHIARPRSAGTWIS